MAHTKVQTATASARTRSLEVDVFHFFGVSAWQRRLHQALHGDPPRGIQPLELHQPFVGGLDIFARREAFYRSNEAVEVVWGRAHCGHVDQSTTAADARCRP